LLDSKRNNQSEWLKAYKKECVQLNASLNNLTEKQLKKLSRLIQNRCRKLISSYGFKDERSKSGTEIISLSENIKDEYKFTFWESVYLYLVEKDSSDLLDNETYLNLFKNDFDFLNKNPETSDQTIAALNFANLINAHLKDAAYKELNFERTFYGKIHNIAIGKFRRNKALMRNNINKESSFKKD